MKRTGGGTAGRNGRAGRRWLAWPCLLLIVCGVLSGAKAGNVRAEDVWAVKAAFIYNFTKYVVWPADLEQQGGELRLCLSGGNPFGAHILALEGRKVRNFNLRILEPATPAGLGQCHILYLAGEGDSPEALAAVAGLPVLVIAGHEDFLEEGGGILLLDEDSRVRFDVNLQRIKANGLEISSRLLHLVRKVI